MNKSMLKPTLLTTVLLLANNLAFADCFKPKTTKSYDYVYCFFEGLAGVKLNDKRGFIDRTGKEVIPLKYEYSLYFSNGIAPVKLNGKWGFINKKGKMVISPKYDDARTLYNGLALVRLNDKYGFINKTGKVVIPLKYDSAYSFEEGLAPVKLNGKWGFVNTSGKMVIEQKYDNVDPSFNDGLVGVALNRRWGVIDKTGKVVTPIKYDYISIENGRVYTRLNGKKSSYNSSSYQLLDQYNDGSSGIVYTIRCPSGSRTSFTSTTDKSTFWSNGRRVNSMNEAVQESCK